MRRHSGFTLLVCADWANTMEPSRVLQLTRWVMDHPENSEHLPPHVIRLECPAGIVYIPERTRKLIDLNPKVLGLTRFMVVDGHSDCAGIGEIFPGYKGDQFERQKAMIENGGQIFTDSLAKHSGNATRVRFTYSQFDSNHKLAGTRVLGTMQNTTDSPSRAAEPWLINPHYPTPI